MAIGTEGDWLQPETGRDPAYTGQVSGPALYELRPLSLGEVLDRTFALFRARFWLFAGITAVSAAVQVVVQVLSLATVQRLAHHAALGSPAGLPAAFALNARLGSQGGSALAGLLFFLVSAIANAATTLALSEVYMNRPATSRTALSVAFKRWYRWIGIAFWLIGSMVWIPFLCFMLGGALLAFGAFSHNAALRTLGGCLIALGAFGGFPAGVVLYLRNALAIPAAMVEDLPVRAAMRRSKRLAAGTKGRIFIVLLIAGVLYSVVGVLESPASLLILLVPGQQHYLAQALTLLISFIGHTVVAPVGMIGLTLLYFDQRVRLEALDLQLLLEESRPGGHAAAAPEPVAAEASAAAQGLAPLG